MNFRFYLLGICTLFSLNFSFGQARHVEMTSKQINTEAELTNYYPILIENAFLEKNKLSHSSVYVQQIGENNYFNSSISSEKGNDSQLNVNQTGARNSFVIEAKVKGIEGNVVQQGNYNTSFSFIDAPLRDVDLNIQQNGNNLHFESFGTNSIGDNIHFNMEGNYKSIIVRNFQ